MLEFLAGLKRNASQKHLTDNICKSCVFSSQKSLEFSFAVGGQVGLWPLRIPWARICHQSTLAAPLVLILLQFCLTCVTRDTFSIMGNILIGND